MAQRLLADVLIPPRGRVQLHHKLRVVYIRRAHHDGIYPVQQCLQPRRRIDHLPRAAGKRGENRYEN